MAKNRARRGQRHRGRARDRRRRGRSMSRRSQTRTCSGRCAAAAATSASPRRSPTGCTRSSMVDGRADRAPNRRGARLAALLPRRGRGRLGRSGRSSPGWCTPRTAPARKLAALDGLPHRRRRTRRSATSRPLKAWGSPLMVEVGPMPYPAMNTHPRRGLPGRVAQLLAVELHARAHR